MKVQDLLLPLFFLVIPWFIFYYFFPAPTGNRAEIVSDHTFVAPQKLVVLEPLNLDVSFVPVALTTGQQTTIKTTYGELTFTSAGGVIDRILYHRLLSGKECLIETIAPTTEQVQGAFLVALAGKEMTPYIYELVENTKTDAGHRVVYKGESSAATITKEFLIHESQYIIDMALTVEPKSGKEVRPRVLFPAPLIPDTKTTDVISAVVVNESQKVEIKTLKEMSVTGKQYPSLFGLEDHYFLHTLLKDTNIFAERAYYKVADVDRAQAILEHSPVREKTTWNLSFYIGPKELSALAATDSRLEAVLGYGWLSPVSKLILYILKFIYGLCHNYGIAIILLALLIHLLLIPFMPDVEQNKRKEAEMQRKLAYIEQKYKHDPEILARERTEFISKHGLSGVSSMLPTLLIRLPLLIGLQRVLNNAIELYKAPFFWIPDLSEADPYYILPFLTFVAFVSQMVITGGKMKPAQLVASMVFMLIIASIFTNFSAGLVLSIAVSVYAGVVQVLIEKAMKA